jgi:alpha-D-ribose 1-methylphosphonate 5-triphosphate synthase subunit PhnH
MPPIQTAFEAESRECFHSLMWALSYPGQIMTLPVAGDAHALAAFATVGRTLLDLETSFFTNDAALRVELERTGSGMRSATDAAYLYFPKLGEADLPLVEQANIGDETYPDNGATLVIGCQLNGPEAVNLRLRGPGIQGERTLSVAGLPAAFWQLRERRIRYPLGIDLFLLDGPALVGLPRTTRIAYE